MPYRWVRSEPLKLFIGYDSKEPLAFHVLAHSILRRATCPIEIVPLVQAQLRARGVYTRERGATESTEFSMTRFLVPYLCGYRGHAVFMDCDMLCLTDIADLWDHIMGPENAAVWVCKHDYAPQEGTKFLGYTQTVYPRKNWSSFMVFDNYQCEALTPEFVNTATGLQLHRLTWVADAHIGSLPLDFNWLVGEYSPKSDAKLLHFTLGGPWFGLSQDDDATAKWDAERQLMMGHA